MPTKQKKKEGESEKEKRKDFRLLISRDRK